MTGILPRCSCVSTTVSGWGDLVIKAMDCGIAVKEFELQSRYYVHFRTNTLGKGMNPTNSPSYGLNSTTTVLLEEWLWHQKNPCCTQVLMMILPMVMMIYIHCFVIKVHIRRTKFSETITNKPQRVDV